MFGLGTTELIIILVIVVILFGSTRLPQIGKGIGEAIKNFKKSTSAADEINVTPTNKAEKTEIPEAGKESKS
ncbi:MAG: twin-arginine translocase TatA/TatE family subunit [Nitrospiraceae bacterium]|nr:MAG: twin-arginine translocase TatA/TatE family subunit [Nitrospiraceae bacterium]